ASSFSLYASTALAQTSRPNIPIRNPDGSVTVDNNARDIRTGPLQNTSDIPLPSILPAGTTNTVPVPVDTSRQAPNTVLTQPDLPYIERSFNELINSGSDADVEYTLQPETVQITTSFDLAQDVGNHGFAEGIQVTIIRADGTREPRPAVFVRGDDVTKGPGQLATDPDLPTAVTETVTYGINDTVELRVLNVREDGAEASESAIYFTRDFREEVQVGEFIVEDLQGGGDRVFNDGNFLEARTGTGTGLALEDRRNLVVTSRTEQTPLDPLIEQEPVVEEDVIVERPPQTSVETVEVSRDRGQVELPEDTPSDLLGHATGVRVEEGQLIYNRYANASRVRLGSDGLGLTGQLSPLNGNPSAPPTLLTGNLTFDTTVDDNEAGLTATAGITQFLTRTHRPAEDALGREIINPNEDGPRLLEPTGIFTNRRLVGYVPTSTAISPDSKIESINGIFNLPADQAVEITPPDPQLVGRGDSAYTDNVGGLILEQPDGTLSFLPQWTKAGYSQTQISLTAGEVSRVIYALVPQQPEQNLQLDETYAVTREAGKYVIADGGFTIISADLQPQNFAQETAEVYAVEDTLPTGNAQIANFNGIRGDYVEVAGGSPIPTVDLTVPSEADARVGNVIFPPVIAGETGQPGYLRTTRAAGFYLTGSFTGGFGNQRDTVLDNQITTVSVANDLVRRQSVNTFSTPRDLVTTISTSNGTITRTTGTADFEINGAGELFNPTFSPLVNAPAPELIPINDVETRTSEEQLRTGERVLISSEPQEEFTLQSDVREISRDEELVTREDSYPNFSAVRGEFALGGVLNFSNTPWTAAANTVRAELFLRDNVFGRSSNGSEAGVRAELVFHPFGEVRRDAYQYDEAGNVIPVYQTEPVMDANGDPVMEVLTGDDGEAIGVVVNQFVLDEAGDRIAQRVGTGKAKGPGAYVRLENVFDDSTEIIGGLQLSF
ncbi:MAG: hypothetical protein WBD47_10345, partial [Phormidesmis sp.]